MYHIHNFIERSSILSMVDKTINEIIYRIKIPTLNVIDCQSAGFILDASLVRETLELISLYRRI